MLHIETSCGTSPAMTVLSTAFNFFTIDNETPNKNDESIFKPNIWHASSYVECLVRRHDEPV